MAEATPLLDVRGLRTVIRSGGREVAMVDGVGFTLERGRMLALVGESGCGKSITALSLLDLLPPQARIAAGSIRLEGRELRGLPAEAMRQVRGGGMAMVFQDPATSLNPVLPIGEQVVEALRAHAPLSARTARGAALELLDRVRLPEPQHRFGEYPHRLSGGMCQRVMIALALAGQPKVLIADEPTTALDVMVQAQILELIARLQREDGTAVLLITHDLGLVAGYADRVAVMYAGRIVEENAVEALFDRPRHPYTQDLLEAAPRFADLPGGERRLREIPGHVPAPGAWPPGCGFAPRCRHAMPLCGLHTPEFEQHGGRGIACLLEQAA